MHCGGERGGGEGCGGEGGGRQGGGISHIAAGIILSASYLLGFDICSLSCLKLKVEVSIVSVHGLEFKRSECTSYYNIACQFRKIRIEKYMKMSLIYYFYSRDGDVRRVVLREER